MIYTFVCDDCRIVNDVDRPAALAGEPAACPICSNDMRRLFFPVPMLNRQKPGMFKWEKSKLDQDADNLAALRAAESQGPQKMREMRKAFGDGIYNKTLQYRKREYG